jgi:hypothetical protein
MKEVKLLDLRRMSEDRSSYPVARDLEGIEKRLADWLNAGWQLAGVGGQSLEAGFVFLVRER